MTSFMVLSGAFQLQRGSFLRVFFAVVRAVECLAIQVLELSVLELEVVVLELMLELEVVVLEWCWSWR